MAKPSETERRRAELQEKLNALLLRYGILLQRAAILSDYLRENISSTRLSATEQNALELLILTTERNLEFCKQRRQQLFNELDK